MAGAVGYIGLLAGIENGTPIGSVLGLLVLVIPIVISFQRQKYLVIRTNDGSVSVFAGPSLESLMDIKQLIDDRLEGTWNGNVIKVDFKNNIEQQIINTENTTVEKAEAVIQDSPGAQYAPNSSGATNASSVAGGITLGKGAILNGHADTSAAASSSAQVTLTQIDFSAALPDAIALYNKVREDFAVSYADKLKLYELLKHMQDGVQERDERDTVRTLATTLSSVFQGYPGAVQMFQNIIALVA